ncbi:MAG: cytochrome c3 family protein [Syntrophobacteraceae bacterium]
MQNAKRRRIGFLVVIGVIVGIAISAATFEISETTSGADFCGSCHTMRPFVSAFEMHVHGGDNRYGFQAQCNDCHLPHDGLGHYLLAKAVAGATDVWGETFENTAKIDWGQKLKDPGRYVYDSGCLSCHRNLEDKSLSNPRAFLPHRMYFAKATTKTCADCHSNAGHKHLAEYINK